MKVIKFMLSGEFLFAVFLLSGAFKETFDWFPVDLTLFTMLITATIALKRLYKNARIDKRIIGTIILFFFFVFITLFSLLYTDSTGYYLDKSLRFIIITSWAFLGTFFVLNSRDSIRKFIFSLVIIASVSSFFIVRNFLYGASSDVGFIGLSDGNYLGSARLIGTGALGILVLYLYKNMNKTMRIIAFFTLLLTAVSLIMTGARMPIISFVLTFLILTLTTTIRLKKGTIYLRKGTKKIALLLILTVPFLSLVKDAAFAQTLQYRINVLFDEGMGASASGRLDRFDTALNMMKENFLLGGGFGSFGVHYQGLDGREYPHNLFLEVGAELGLIGLIIITALICLVLFRSLKSIKNGDYVSVWIFASLIYLLVNAMVSGDLNDNRMLFALMGIAAHYPLYISEAKELDV